MDMELKKNTYNFYEKALWQSFSCEVMRENIVPDSCADIARIIDTTGYVCVISREFTGDGRICASGCVHVSVLYIPEKGDGPCALRFQIPFQSCSEGQGAGECEFPDVCGELRSIDTRLLNPRKVLTRADLSFSPSGCLKRSLSPAFEAAQGDDTLQLMQKKQEIRTVVGVSEKEFSFSEEMPVSPGRQGIEEILSVRSSVRGADCKLIGSKLVVKGLLSAVILYRDSESQVALQQQEIPFSQILEGSGLREDDEFEAVFRTLSMECRIGTETSPNDPHMISLSAMLRTRVTAYRRENVLYIADLYSTALQTNCQRMDLELTEESHTVSRRLAVRELLETGTSVRQVIDTRLRCGMLRISGEEMEAPVWVQCLYLDENEVLRSVGKEFTVSGSVDLPAMVQAAGDSCLQGDLLCAVQPDGIEVRFTLDCRIEYARRGRHSCVCAVETEEADAQAGRPSLVLRKFSRDESLWSVAKQYRTTCRAILSVNGLEGEEAIPLDRLLLIPTAR